MAKDDTTVAETSSDDEDYQAEADKRARSDSDSDDTADASAPATKRQRVTRQMRKANPQEYKLVELAKDGPEGCVATEEPSKPTTDRSNGADASKNVDDDEAPTEVIQDSQESQDEECTSGTQAVTSATQVVTSATQVVNQTNQSSSQTPQQQEPTADCIPEPSTKSAPEAVQVTATVQAFATTDGEGSV